MTTKVRIAPSAASPATTTSAVATPRGEEQRDGHRHDDGREVRHDLPQDVERTGDREDPPGDRTADPQDPGHGRPDAVRCPFSSGTQPSRVGSRSGTARDGWRLVVGAGGRGHGI
ncbi:hypothetical protein GCM10009836_73290 [Pseudonocardia ailaonensis]|uniref:Uncharacterized protein n=1 Tax=Pseudonocardia ailaonensis TaxID=367279 RepID=A0ABN2NPY8_9PSEU